MRPSKFNVYIDSFPEHDESLVFNTFNDSRVIVNRRLKKAMERARNGGRFTYEEMTYLEQLKDLGVMVDDDVDEDRELDYWFQRFKFDHSTLSITILTTYACNLRCSYCFQEGYHRNSFMDKDICRIVVDWIVRRLDEVRPTTLRLTFYGGEPLLNVTAVKLIAQELFSETSKRKITQEISIVTNGVLLTRKLVDWLVPLGLRGVKVTLDGDEEAHDAKRPFRNGRGTFKTIIANLEQIKGKVPIAIGGNFDDSNKYSVPSLLDKLVETGFNGDLERVDFRPIFSNFESMKLPHMTHKTCAFSDIQGEDILWLRDEVENRGFRAGEGVALGPCEACREYTYTIDPGGKIYKCPGFVGKEDFAIGNLQEDALNHRNTRFMTVDLWKRCKDCPYIPLCGGGCRSSAYVKDGDFEEVTCEKEYFQKVALELVKREYLSNKSG